MNFDYLCNQLGAQLAQIVNESGLPMTAILYVIDQLRSEVEEARKTNIRRGEWEVAKAADEEQTEENVSQDEQEIHEE